MSEFEVERRRIKEVILDISRILNRLNIRLEPTLAEDFSAKSEPPLDVCVSKVRECDIFICLIGKRYGSVVKNNLSPTHVEYRTAYDEWVKSGKEKPEILIYVLDIDEKRDVRERAVEDFINEVSSRHYYRGFKDSEELASKVKDDLINVIFEKHIGVKKSSN